jgi:hypothetical protein
VAVVGVEMAARRIGSRLPPGPLGEPHLRTIGYAVGSTLIWTQLKLYWA